MKDKKRVVSGIGPPRRLSPCPKKKVVPFSVESAQRMRDEVFARMQTMKVCTIYFGGDPD